MKSKIQSELVEATGVKPSRGEERNEFIGALMKGVAALKDPEWEALSKAAQNWYNDSADSKNAGKGVLEFPDLEKEDAAEEKTTSRRGSSKDAGEAQVVKVGMIATVTTLRDKVVTGKVVEKSSEVIVLDVDGKEEEFMMERVKSVTIKNDGKDSPDDDGPADFTPKVGLEVTVVTKRGKTITGKIVELDADVMVLKTDDGEEELNRDRIETIKAVGGAKSEEKTSGRRGSSEDKAEDKGADEKTKRSSNAEGVSIGARIKELIAEDMEATEVEIGKALTKEGIEFKDNTLKLNYTDAHKFIAILKKAKKLK